MHLMSTITKQQPRVHGLTIAVVRKQTVKTTEEVAVVAKSDRKIQIFKFREQVAK